MIANEHRDLEMEKGTDFCKYDLDTLKSLNDMSIRERDSAKRVVEFRRKANPNDPRHHYHLRKWMNRQKIAGDRVNKVQMAIKDRKINIARDKSADCP